MSESAAPAPLPATETIQERIAFYTRSLNEAFQIGGEKGYHDARAGLGRVDLFYLLVYILNRKDLLHPWIFARVNEVQAHPDGYLDLWAREHYKSSIGTFGLNIQEILKNPEITIGIFSHTRAIAKGFLKQIKLELETNGELKFLYPDVLWADPENQSPSWSLEHGLIVKRKGNPKEATIEAWGVVDSQPTSKHFDILDFDDLVSEGTVNTPEQIDRTISSWANALNLGRRGGRVRYKGTKWHFNDPYNEIIARGAAIPRRHPATHDGTPTGKPVLLTPEEFTEKYRKMGPYVGGCQLLLDPKADSKMSFKEEDLRFWPGVNQTNLAKVILVDPASKKKKTSDNTAMWVLGYGSDDSWYVCDFVYDKLSLPERVATVMRLHREHRPIFVGYEEYGQQADIEAINTEQERTNYRFDITPLGGSLKKEDRILRLQSPFAAHKIYLLPTLLRMNWERQMVDLMRAFIEQEFKPFPVATRDDGLDCLARIEDEEVKSAVKLHRPADSGVVADRDVTERLLDEYGGAGTIDPAAWMGA